ncbi:hypothetical protein SAMN02745945_00158 [Peptoclostridium litorale DSM 5388]|uniref:Copper amine oxidase-like N-terminal domain-containing protein n=1 Tax=Peptoclostridium litorale DSM 5388 TaxID=1121324 RepID=A0A069RHX0_PEPLI|nr:hypothetical protein [Peptoclostridium litorale]KDR96594.1 hypothetical protein CLIT_2c02000 [Peptoclostridium litorale DSM 5388]SIN68702.1 hypothetical protein SAMN02745945_00158 [Peptoclostridium litorale DSM 5388]
MKKRMTGILVVAFFAASSIFSVASAETVNARVADHRVNLNGHIVFNRLIEYPLMEYRDVTYVPMTTDNLQVLGLGMQWSPTEGISIYKDGVVRDFVMPEINKELASTSRVVKMDIADFNIEVNGEIVDNSEEEYPVLFKNDLVYFPLTWRFVTGEFEGTIIWNDEYGLSIYNHENSKLTKNQIYIQNQKQYLQDSIARYETVLEMYDVNREQYSDIENSLKKTLSSIGQSIDVIEDMKNDSFKKLEKDMEFGSKEVIVGAEMGISDITEETDEEETPKVKYEVGNKYALESILESGRYIQLEDESIWEVNTDEEQDLSVWEKGSNIILLESQNKTYPYKMLNIESDESVEVKLLSN